MKRKDLNKKRERREKRSRAKISSAADKRSRLSVFRSNKEIYAQVINDIEGKTLASASSKETKAKTKTEAAKEVGKLIAEKAKKAGVGKVVFDKGRYNYHGRVKALAEEARKGGLEF